MDPGSAAHHAARAARCASSGAHIEGGKFCRRRHQLPGLPGYSMRKNPMFYWLFRDGMAFAL